MADSTEGESSLTVPAAAVQKQLQKMLGDRLFRHSPRLSRFFTFIVQEALAGTEQRLKEYAIALEVFGKPESFDPRMDSAVRIAARQLRAKIDLYYLTEGSQDEVLIRLRPGDYVPRFYKRSNAPPIEDIPEEPDVATESLRTPLETSQNVFEIRLDPRLTAVQVAGVLQALAEYYRGSGGLGIELELELEDVLAPEPTYA